MLIVIVIVGVAGYQWYIDRLEKSKAEVAHVTNRVVQELPSEIKAQYEADQAKAQETMKEVMEEIEVEELPAPESLPVNPDPVDTPTEVPIIEPTEEEPTPVNEEPQELPNTKPSIPSQQGTFTKVDLIHFAKGTVQTVAKDDAVYIIFSEDFETPRGPDLYVLLGKESSIKDNEVQESEAYNLGALAEFKGTQAYKVPMDIFEQYDHTVIIWCRAFDELFSTANLAPMQ